MKLTKVMGFCMRRGGGVKGARRRRRSVDGVETLRSVRRPFRFGPADVATGVVETGGGEAGEGAVTDGRFADDDRLRPLVARQPSGPTTAAAEVGVGLALVDVRVHDRPVRRLVQPGYGIRLVPLRAPPPPSRRAAARLRRRARGHVLRRQLRFLTFSCSFCFVRSGTVGRGDVFNDRF